MVPLIQIPVSLFIAGGLAIVLLVGLAVLLSKESVRRRRVERAAAEVRSQLQTVTATMREGVIAYDMDRRLKFVNPAFERLTGYPAAQLLGLALEYLSYAFAWTAAPVGVRAAGR